MGGEKRKRAPLRIFCVKSSAPIIIRIDKTAMTVQVSIHSLSCSFMGVCLSSCDNVRQYGVGKQKLILSVAEILLRNT